MRLVRGSLEHRVFCDGTFDAAVPFCSHSLSNLHSQVRTVVGATDQFTVQCGAGGRIIAAAQSMRQPGIIARLVHVEIGAAAHVNAFTSLLAFVLCLNDLDSIVVACEGGVAVHFAMCPRGGHSSA